jgi:hypothetical protein
MYTDIVYKFKTNPYLTYGPSDRFLLNGYYTLAALHDTRILHGG